MYCDIPGSYNIKMNIVQFSIINNSINITRNKIINVDVNFTADGFCKAGPLGKIIVEVNFFKTNQTGQ